MKNKALALSIALIASLPSLPGFAEAASEDGAKGLFFKQLDAPKSQFNTCVQYWIELHRGSQILHVNNKTSFKSGDEIQFHVKPNVDGYAYILLRSGSRGEQAVLFPDSKAQEENSVTAGREYVLPEDGRLKFDQNPGVEKLTLVLSRTPINTSAYLNDSAKPSTAQLVASIDSGSKDLIPTQILVSYNDPTKEDAGPPKHAAVSAPPESEEVPAKTPPAKASSAKGPVTTTKTPIKHVVVTKSHNKIANAPVQNHTASTGAGVVTIVHKDPEGTLAVDVALLHR